MAYLIEWTLHAQNELNTLYDYLEENWTSREIIQFSNLLDETLSVILKFPFIYPVFEQNKLVRRCVLSKQTSLYFQIMGERIIILSLFDNRQDPNRLKI